MPTIKPNKLQEVLKRFRISGTAHKADSTESMEIGGKSFHIAASAEVLKGGKIMPGDSDKEIVQATAKTQEVVSTPPNQAADKMQAAAGVEAEVASKVSEDSKLEDENKNKRFLCSALNEVLSVNKGYAYKISNFLKHWETWQQVLSPKLRGEAKPLIELFQGALAELNKLNTYLEQLGLGDANLIEKLDETKAVEGIEIAYTQMFPKLLNYFSAIINLKEKIALSSIVKEIAKKATESIIEGTQKILPKTYFSDTMILPVQIVPRVPITLKEVKERVEAKNSVKIEEVISKVRILLNNLNMSVGDEVVYKKAMLTLAEQNNFAPAFHNLGVMFIKDDPTAAQIFFELAYYHATTKEQRDSALQSFQEAVKNNGRNNRKSSDLLELRFTFEKQLDQKKDELCKSAEGLTLIEGVYNAKLQAAEISPEARICVLQELKSFLVNVSRNFPNMAEECAGVIENLLQREKQREQQKNIKTFTSEELELWNQAIKEIKQYAAASLASISTLISSLSKDKNLNDDDLLKVKDAIDTLQSLSSSKILLISGLQFYIEKLREATNDYGKCCIDAFNKLSGLSFFLEVVSAGDKDTQNKAMLDGVVETSQAARDKVDFAQNYLLKPTKTEKAEVITAKLIAEEALGDNKEWLERMDQAHSRLFTQNKAAVKAGFTRLTEKQIKFLVHGASKGHGLSLYTLGRTLTKMGCHGVAKDYFKLAAYHTEDNQLRTTVLECYKQSVKEANGKNRNLPENLKKQLGWSEAFSAQIDKNQNELINDVDKGKASKASIRRARVILAELEAKPVSKSLFSFFGKKESTVRPAFAEAQRLLWKAGTKDPQLGGDCLKIAEGFYKAASNTKEREAIDIAVHDILNAMNKRQTKDQHLLYQGIELLTKYWEVSGCIPMGMVSRKNPTAINKILQSIIADSNEPLRRKADQLLARMEKVAYVQLERAPKPEINEDSAQRNKKQDTKAKLEDVLNGIQDIRPMASKNTAPIPKGIFL